MKCAKRLLLVCLGILMSSNKIYSDTRLIAYLQHAPADILQEAEDEAEEQKLLDKLDTIDQKPPSYLSKRQAKARLRELMLPHRSGILALYSGYSDYSNADGLLSFPLRHADKKIFVAITENIKLVKAAGHTISHIEFIKNNNTPAELYELDKKVDEAEQPYWSIKKAPLPTDNIIPATSLIILTKPKNIIVPQGDVMSVKTNHMILPAIYLVGNNNYVQTVSRLLNIQSYFEPIDVIRQKAGEKTVQERISNI